MFLSKIQRLKNQNLLMKKGKPAQKIINSAKFSMVDDCTILMNQIKLKKGPKKLLERWMG